MKFASESLMNLCPIRSPTKLFRPPSTDLSGCLYTKRDFIKDELITVQESYLKLSSPHGEGSMCGSPREDAFYFYLHIGILGKVTTYAWP